jgi:archaellum biogenesis protein FlaJ (TadC family)
MSLKKRWNSKTPKFWKKVQQIAIVAGTIAGIIIAAPVALPAAVITAATYVVTAGTVAATLSQLTVEDTKKIEDVDNAANN